MNTEIVGNSYENGKRVSMQKVTYDKSDDLFKLANLQRQYEVICERIAALPEGADASSLESEKARLETLVGEQTAYIAGYDEQEG